MWRRDIEGSVAKQGETKSCGRTHIGMVSATWILEMIGVIYYSYHSSAIMSKVTIICKIHKIHAHKFPWQVFSEVGEALQAC